MDTAMKRYGFHRLITPQGQVLSHQVVCVDEEGGVLNVHALKEEEPFTQWIGGWAVLVPLSCLPSQSMTVNEWLELVKQQQMNDYTITSTPCLLYQLPHIPLHDVVAALELKAAWVRV